MKKFLTEEERSRVLELRSSNVSIINICKEVHRGKDAVTKFLTNPEEYAREAELYKANPFPNRVMPKFLTEDERNKILELRAQEYTVDKICKEIHRGREVVTKFLKNPDGYVQEMEEFINNPFAKNFNTSFGRSTIPPIKMEEKTFLTDDERNKILELRDQEVPIEEICKEINQDEETVNKFLENPDEYVREMEEYLNNSLKDLLHDSLNVSTFSNSSGLIYRPKFEKRYLTEEERSRILELREQSTSIQNICKELHRGKEMINRFLRDPEAYIKEAEEYKNNPHSLSSTPKVRKPAYVPPRPTFTLKKFLTKAEREKIQEGLTEGKTVSNIALSLGRGTQTIRTYLDNPDGYEDLIAASIAEQQAQVNKYPNFLPKSVRAQIMKMKRSGLSITRIAERLRKPRDTVLTFLKNPDNYDNIVANQNQSDGILKGDEKLNGKEYDYTFDPSKLKGNKKVVKRYLNEFERSKILEMREQSLSIKDISRLVHRGIDTIRRFLKNPQKYTEEVQAYHDYRARRKKAKAAAASSGSFRNLNNSEEGPRNLRKVSIEYRSVIKYLVKKGFNADFIQNELQEVYGEAPDFEHVLNWVTQFQQGRETVVNDPRYLKAGQTLVNGMVKEENSTVDDGQGDVEVDNVDNGNSSGYSNVIKKQPVKLKLFNIKFKPLKRLKD